MLSAADRRHETENLAASLPDMVSVRARHTTAHPGGASRQRAGAGEDFWQYRAQTQDDPASVIDWRRSATGDDLFVREHELQTARLLGIWVDPKPGFRWPETEGTTAKSDHGVILSVALAKSFCEGGDQATVLGGPSRARGSSGLIETMLADLSTLEAMTAPPPPPRQSSALIIASDFYGPLPAFQSWIAAEAGAGRKGILLQICDPDEVTFPYEGRVRFSEPSGPLNRLFGRSEQVRDAYLDRFAKRQADVKAIAENFGWAFITHVTDQPLLETAFACQSALAMLDETS